MYGLAGLRSTLEIFRVQLNLNFAATRCMCSSITEIKREMCIKRRCPLVYVLFLKGACNWDVLGQFFFYPLHEQIYLFILLAIPTSFLLLPVHN